MRRGLTKRDLAMAYGYRRYRSYRYRSNWGYNPPSKYTKLQGIFGSAVDEIKRQFFMLDSDAMDELLADYGAAHGKSAENYARATMPKWKSGATKLSGQTMERLIELVPPYLSAKQRLEILKLILARHHRTPSTQTIKINVKEPGPGLAAIDTALQQLRVTDELAYLPPYVMEAAKWLYDDDMTAARGVMVSLAAAETRALKASAEREIALLKQTLQSTKIKAASYSVRTPGGNLEIVAYTPSLCFVATTCFGQHDRRTETLRFWRDEVLLQRAWGRRFIVWYYLNGEQLSQRIAQRPYLLGPTRILLTMFTKALTIFRIPPSRGGRNTDV